MTDSEKRGKVIRGLEACNRQSYNGSDCQNCPYYDDEDTAELPFGICNIQDMFDDALAMLKEQEARVMTKSEVTQYLSIASNGFQAADIDEPPLWIEHKNPKKYDVKWVEFGTVYTWMNDREISSDYGKEFRFWTSRPTPEQMRETKWEDTDNG